MSNAQTKKTKESSLKLEPSEATEIFTASLQWLKDAMNIHIQYENKPDGLMLFLPKVVLLPSPSGKPSIQPLPVALTSEGNKDSSEGNIA